MCAGGGPLLVKIWRIGVPSMRDFCYVLLEVSAFGNFFRVLSHQTDLLGGSRTFGADLRIGKLDSES